MSSQQRDSERQAIESAPRTLLAVMADAEPDMKLRDQLVAIAAQYEELAANMDAKPTDRP